MAGSFGDRLDPGLPAGSDLVSVILRKVSITFYGFLFLLTSVARDSLTLYRSWLEYDLNWQNE